VIPEPRVLDTVTRTALLGVRFWDRVTGRVVADGLELAETGTGLLAHPNPSGVFAFHDLPGFRDSAGGAGGPSFWSSPPGRRDLVFELSDAERRFVPFRFTADVPHEKMFADDCGGAASPPDAAVGGMPLYSAPSRVAPAGTAAVRAQLWDVAAGAAAASAVLEVTTAAGATHRGVADDQGRVAVLFPYPEPPWAATSPPSGSSLPAQTWALTIGVAYAPASPPVPAGAAPDICAVLTQPSATALETESPQTPLGPQTLAFGRELVLRTNGHSVLLVQPA
jgi:hypothetical protein